MYIKVQWFDCLVCGKRQKLLGFENCCVFLLLQPNLYQRGKGNYNKSFHAWNPSWLLLINFRTLALTFQITSPLIKTSLIHFNFSQSSLDGSLHALERIADAHVHRQVSFISHRGNGMCFIIQRKRERQGGSERDAKTHILKDWIRSPRISPSMDECHSLSTLWRSDKNCFWRVRPHKSSSEHPLRDRFHS